MFTSASPEPMSREVLGNDAASLLSYGQDRLQGTSSTCPVRTSSTVSSARPTATSRPSTRLPDDPQAPAASRAPVFDLILPVDQGHPGTPPAPPSPRTRRTSTGTSSSSPSGRLQRRRLDDRRPGRCRPQSTPTKIPFWSSSATTDVDLSHIFKRSYFGSIRQCYEMGALAVGATIYFGNDSSRDEIAYVGHVQRSPQLRHGDPCSGATPQRPLQVKAPDGRASITTLRPTSPAGPTIGRPPSGRHHQKQNPDQQRRIRRPPQRRQLLRQVGRNACTRSSAAATGTAKGSPDRFIAATRF